MIYIVAILAGGLMCSAARAADGCFKESRFVEGALFTAFTASLFVALIVEIFWGAP